MRDPEVGQCADAPRARQAWSRLLSTDAYSQLPAQHRAGAAIAGMPFLEASSNRESERAAPRNTLHPALNVVPQPLSLANRTWKYATI